MASPRLAGSNKGVGEEGRGVWRQRKGGGEGEGGEMSVEELQASVEELLGMQGLGSGSWKKSGVPAAVEREQRTLVREVKVGGVLEGEGGGGFFVFFCTGFICVYLCYFFGGVEVFVDISRPSHRGRRWAGGGGGTRCWK